MFAPHHKLAARELVRVLRRGALGHLQLDARRFERETVEFPFDSREDALAAYETNWSPFVKTRELLEPEGRWSDIRAELDAVLERHGNQAGTWFTYPGEYLTAFGKRR